MIKDAEQFADQDKKNREEAELRNAADNMVYTAERTKKDLTGKITADQTANIDTAITALKDALAKNDMTSVKAKTDELSKILQDIGTAIYQQAAAQAKAQQGAQPGPSAGPQPGQEQEQEPPPSGPSERRESGRLRRPQSQVDKRNNLILLLIFLIAVKLYG